MVLSVKVYIKYRLEIFDMSKPQEMPDWSDPEAVERFLANEGLGEIDDTEDTRTTRIGVGAGAMAVASSNPQDYEDYQEDNAEPAVDIDNIE